MIEVWFEPPPPFKNWDDFFDNAPKGTEFIFGQESSTWTCDGGGKWRTRNYNRGTTKNHLRHYTRHGVSIRKLPLEVMPAGDLSLAQLVALEEFVNEKIKDAYERGKQDGWSKGYAEGISEHECF